MMKTIKVKHYSEIPDNYTGMVEHANGYKAWCKNGQRHRLNGPAIEHADGTKAWYINGKEYTEQDFKMWMEFYRSASGKYYL